MLLIEHRVNTVEHLRRVPPWCGVEVDIREAGGTLCLAHDPFGAGERLEDWLKVYQHALIVFNVKCDGLEEPILKLIEKFRISEFFFLDVAYPTLVRLVRRGIRQVAVRYSEVEPMELALAFKGKVNWVWVDCFTHVPLNKGSYQQLHEWFKICVVSPELQRHPRPMIQALRRELDGMAVDAVCTNLREEWVGNGIKAPAGGG